MKKEGNLIVRRHRPVGRSRGIIGRNKKKTHLVCIRVKTRGTEKRRERDARARRETMNTKRPRGGQGTAWVLRISKPNAEKNKEVACFMKEGPV